MFYRGRRAPTSHSSEAIPLITYRADYENQQLGYVFKSKMISGKGLNTIMVGFMAIAVFILFDISRTVRTIGVFGAEVNCNSLQKSHQITVEDRAKLSPLVLHTLAVYTNPSNLTDTQAAGPLQYSAHFWLISVYKGAEEVAAYFQIADVDDVAIYNVHDR